MTTVVRRGFPAVVLLVALGVLVYGASRPLSNTDTYFHLRFGREFLDGWSPRDPGGVSSFATREWLPTQWLAQVVMAGLEQLGGLAAVAWLSGLQLVLLGVAVTVTTRARADLLPSAVLTVLALVACGPSLSMRPQVLSYVLMAVAVHLWWRASETGRAPWLLVPLTWLWATWHGMWPMAVVVGLVGLAAYAGTRRPGRRELLRTALVVPACAVAAAVTPVGPGLYSAVLAVGERSSYFSEWGPPELVSPTGAALLLVAAPAVVGLRDADLRTLLFVVLGLGLAVASIRTVPLAAVTLAPLSAAALQRLLPTARTATTRPERWGAAGVAVAALAVLAAVVPRTADEPAEVPTWADRAAALPAGTKVLNDWGEGGYVMWAFPQLDPLMHGYGDSFTLDELERNADILRLEPGWDALVRETGVEYAYVLTDSPLAYALELEGWVVLETDERVSLLEPPPGWMAEVTDSELAEVTP